MFELTMNRLDGQPEPLSKYQGQVIMLVNVASKCGLTPQYTGLQAMYDRYRERGFTILGFPANDFREQEPGTDAEIADFCQRNYGVTFPVFSKIAVTGDAMHPLYRELTGQPEPIGGDVRWNFQKYLVARDGTVAACFSPRTEPDAPEVVEALESLLATEAS
ncbi:MAG: glutathione peroxidase [Dehalococcoidia bacterium]|nr:glutathione peroxidase [Dehalococcoidia bacterium]